METILFINACARPHSRTYQLAQHVLQGFPGRVLEINLYEENIPPLDWSLLQQRENCVQQGDDSAAVFRYAKQFAEADVIVFAAPYWDLLFPAVVRSYLEAVTVAGITFQYENGMPAGLCAGRELIYVTTAGGVIGTRNFALEYLTALAHTFYGIPKVRSFTAEGLDIDGADIPAIMREAKNRVEAELHAERCLQAATE